MKLGIMLPNWVGDVAMATPTLRALRARYPQARMIGIARPYLLPLITGTPWFDELLPWGHHGRGLVGRTCRLVRRLRSERLDVMVLLRASLYSAAVARASGARRIVGYAKNYRRWLLTDPVRPLHHGRGSTPVSAVDDYLQLAAVLGCDINDRQLQLATTPDDELAAEEIWRRWELPPGRVLLLNSGGAYGAAKHWPTDHCASLARAAAQQLGLATLVLCGPAEREEARRIAAAADHPLVHSMADEDLSFGTTKALIRRGRLMVTTDSGPRHIASALGTPTVVLFGPIDPRWSRNYQRDSIELHLSLDCAPCGRRVCPLGHGRCMSELGVDRVLAAMRSLLTRTAERALA